MNRIASFLGTGWKRILILAALAIIALLLAFQLGIFVGYHEAQFSYRSGARFYRQVMVGDQDDTGGFFGIQATDDFSPSHGAAGKVVSVTLPFIVIASPNHAEQTAVVGSSTVIRMFRSAASASEIRPGDYAIILGDPDQAGRIDARFIRIAPLASSSSPAPYATATAPVR